MYHETRNQRPEDINGQRKNGSVIKNHLEPNFLVIGYKQKYEKIPLPVPTHGI